MENRLRSKGNNKYRLIDRLDKATRDVNVFLLVVVIGLAMLDFTAYCAFKITEEMPVSFAAGATAPASTQTIAAAAPAQAAVSHGSTGQAQPTTVHVSASAHNPYGTAHGFAPP